MIHVQRPQGETTMCDRSPDPDDPAALNVVRFEDFALARGPFCERCEELTRERMATKA